MMKFRFPIAHSAVLLLAAMAQPLLACPFCSAVSQTFSEEIGTMDTVVIARLIELPPPAKADSGSVSDVAKAKFVIESVVKGAGVLGKSKTLEAVYFGEAKTGKQFLVMGVDPPNIMWSTPLQISDTAVKYLKKLPTLPKEGADRLVFFQDYLESKDEMLARDAYDEFAKAPYSAVKALKKNMKHDQLIEWIKDRDIPASRRRLYLTLLGVCGSEKDLALLESLLRSSDRKARAGLDAMIACYLTLKGEKGLPLIEDLFLKNKKCEYADTYAAIMAIRFHGTEGGVIERPRLLKSLHHMLERPQLADLVIPDLARWEDWSQVERLVKLFKEADEKTSWVRVPVINYLRRCPMPSAKDKIKELEKIDPGAVKRANTFFPFEEKGGKDKSKTSKVEAPTIAPSINEKNELADADSSSKPETKKAEAEAKPLPSANRYVLLSVPMLVGVCLFGLQLCIHKAGRSG